jgi:hypothetical protein
MGVCDSIVLCATGCSRALLPIGETLFEGCENADIGVGVAFALGTRAMVAEECFDAVGEVSRLLPIDMDDQGRAFAIAVVDNDRAR